MSGANPRAPMFHPPMFNPRPRIERLAIGPRHDCLVIDDALLEPERWVEYAATHRGDFAELERQTIKDLSPQERATLMAAAKKIVVSTAVPEEVAAECERLSTVA